MKVKRLIEQLNKMNPEADVKLHHPLGDNALFLLCTMNDDSVVWLESKCDIDIGGELYSHYKDTPLDKAKELYEELLDIGFKEADINEYLPEIYEKFKFDNDDKLFKTKFDRIDLSFTERHGEQRNVWVIGNKENQDICVMLSITDDDIKNNPGLEKCTKPLTFGSETACQDFIHAMYIENIDNCYPKHLEISYFDHGCFRAESLVIDWEDLIWKSKELKSSGKI